MPESSERSLMADIVPPLDRRSFLTATGLTVGAATLATPAHLRRP